MFGISGAEVMFIALIALVVLGPEKMLVVVRKAGQIAGELRKVSAGFEAEMRSAMAESDRPHPYPAERSGATGDQQGDQSMTDPPSELAPELGPGDEGPISSEQRDQA